MCLFRFNGNLTRFDILPALRRTAIGTIHIHRRTLLGAAGYTEKEELNVVRCVLPIHPIVQKVAHSIRTSENIGFSAAVSCEEDCFRFVFIARDILSTKRIEFAWRQKKNKYSDHNHCFVYSHAYNSQVDVVPWCASNTNDMLSSIFHTLYDIIRFRSFFWKRRVVASGKANLVFIILNFKSDSGQRK